jgi:hypothetical protein
MTATVVSVFGMCNLPSPITNWIIQVVLCALRYARSIWSCLQCLVVSDALNDIDSTKTIMQVIMIARLHAMYQGSRKVLILLVIVFLVVNISGVVITVIVLRHISVGKL